MLRIKLPKIIEKRGTRKTKEEYKGGKKEEQKVHRRKIRKYQE